jgi:lipoprotein-anchoring transpeptidase ErfK/SrfK
MRDISNRSLTAMSAVVLLAGACVLADATSAAAQGLIFDWGGEKTVDSGKAHVKFNGGGKPGDIIVSFGDRKLYHIVAPGEADTYPIAIPRDQSRWEGVTSVSMKKENPSWTPTAHMVSENPKLPRWVPGGHPMNPLGIRALYLGSSDYRIHGTDAPWTIGTAASKGCVRMFNKDVVDLYPRVKVGAKVTVTWQKFDGKTAPSEVVASKATPEPETGKTTLASLTPDDNLTGSSSRSKAGKTADSADEPRATGSEKPKPAREAATVPVDEPSTRKRKARAEDATVEETETPAAKPKAAVLEEATPRKQKQRPAKAAEGTGESNDQDRKPAVATAADTSTETRSARKAKVAAVETGSIEAGKPDASAASLAIAERALAAAERAAQAAERAAAAAERAVAASLRQPATAGHSTDATP